MEKYLCWYAHREPYVPHDIMVEMIVGSTSSASNMHEVIDDNNNLYRYGYGCDWNEKKKKMNRLETMFNKGESPTWHKGRL